MKVRYVLFCEYSSETRDGKMNVLGITDTIFARDFPAVHREAHILVSFEVAAQDVGSQVVTVLELLDADAKHVFRTETPFRIEAPLNFLNQRHIVHDLMFQAPGPHVMNVYVNGELVAQTPLAVVKHTG